MDGLIDGLMDGLIEPSVGLGYRLVAGQVL